MTPERLLKDDCAFSLLHQDFSHADLGIMPPLGPVVKILKKRGHRKILGESGGQTYKGSDREKCQLWYFVNF